MRACLQSRGVLSSEVGTSLTGDGERSALVGESVLPQFVSDIELMVRGLFVVVGFTTFRASLELLLHEGESCSQVLMKLFQLLVSSIGGDEIQVTRLIQQV